MRQIRETLRLHLQAGLSHSEVGRALKFSKSAVGKCITLARVAGVDWEHAQSLSDEKLQARVNRPALPRGSHHLAPDFGVVQSCESGLLGMDSSAARKSKNRSTTRARWSK